MGGLVSFLLSLMFFYFGAKRYKRGKKVSGVILFLLGLMFAGGWLPALIGLAVTVIFGLAILGGGAYIVLKLFNKLKEDHEPVISAVPPVKIDSSFDDEWNAFLKKQHKN
jgi:hypothetical protein